MSVPVTPVLDYFARTSLGPQWTTATSNGDLTISSEAVTGAVAGNGRATFNPQTFGPGCEVFATLATWNPTSPLAALGARFNGITRNGYEFRFTDAVVAVGRVDTGTFTTLQSLSMAVAAGDSMGLRVAGVVLTGWHKPSGGSWRPVVSAVDSTYTGAGAISIFISQVAGQIRIDDFGGGDWPPAYQQAATTLAGARTYT